MDLGIIPIQQWESPWLMSSEHIREASPRYPVSRLSMSLMIPMMNMTPSHARQRYQQATLSTSQTPATLPR